MAKQIAKKPTLEISVESARDYWWLMNQESMPRNVKFSIASGSLTVEDNGGYRFGFTRSVPAYTPETKPGEPVEFFLGLDTALDLMQVCTGTVSTWHYMSPDRLEVWDAFSVLHTFVKVPAGGSGGPAYGAKGSGGLTVPADMFHAATEALVASPVRTLECSNGHLYGDGWMTAIRSRVPLDLPDFAIPGDSVKALRMFNRDGKTVTISVTPHHVKFSQAHLSVYFARMSNDALLPSAVMKSLMTGTAHSVPDLNVVMAKKLVTGEKDVFPQTAATVSETFALSGQVEAEIRTRLGNPVAFPTSPQYTLYLSEARPLQTFVVSNDLVDIAAPATG